MLDGTDLSAEYLMVEAMNIPLAGPNVQLAPGADLGDDLLDLVTVSERERRLVEEYLRARLAGEAAPSSFRSVAADASSSGPAPDELHVDDDAWKPEPHIDRLPEDRAEGEVSIGLGTGGRRSGRAGAGSRVARSAPRARTDGA